MRGAAIRQGRCPWFSEQAILGELSKKSEATFKRMGDRQAMAGHPFVIAPWAVAQRRIGLASIRRLVDEYPAYGVPRFWLRPGSAAQ